jgi:hypothetical protein
LSYGSWDRIQPEVGQVYSVTCWRLHTTLGSFEHFRTPRPIIFDECQKTLKSCVITLVCKTSMFPFLKKSTRV